MRNVLGMLLGLALVFSVSAAWAEYESGDRAVAIEKASAVYMASVPVSDLGRTHHSHDVQ